MGQETVVADEQVGVSREQTPVPTASSESAPAPVSEPPQPPQDETEMKKIPEDVPASQTTLNTNTQDKRIEEKEKSEPSKPVLENPSQQNDLQSDVQSVSESMHKQPEVPQKSDNQSQVAAAKVSKEEEKMVQQVQPAALNTAEVKETPAKEMSPQNEQT